MSTRQLVLQYYCTPSLCQKRGLKNIYFFVTADIRVRAAKPTISLIFFCFFIFVDFLYRCVFWLLHFVALCKTPAKDRLVGHRSCYKNIIIMLNGKYVSVPQNIYRRQSLTIFCFCFFWTIFPKTVKFVLKKFPKSSKVRTLSKD